MSTQRGITPFHCSQDCRQEGCPGHELELRLSNADTMAVILDGVEILHQDRAVLEAIYYTIAMVPSMSGVKRSAHAVPSPLDLRSDEAYRRAIELSRGWSSL